MRPGRDRLAGVVEEDEIYIGGEKPGKRGRGAEGKARVLIAAQLDGERSGRIRLRRVRDAAGASLEPAVQEAVEPGSVVRTDGWGGYNNLDHLGYVREIGRKNVDVGDNLLPRCNRVAALLSEGGWGLIRVLSVVSIWTITSMTTRFGSTAGPRDIAANSSTGLFSKP